MTTDEDIAGQYEKKTQLEHILLRPQMYIGSTDTINKDLFLFNKDNTKIVKCNAKFNSGFNRIFEEILLNAFDNITRPRTETNIIKVNIDKENNTISVFNNGKGIDIIKKKEYNMYIPEMIFGELLTSSNYNDNDKRIVGGQNGLGAKLCNIFSSEFILETVDKRKKLKCEIKWIKNMSSKEYINISKYDDEPYTKITFKPDLNKFNLTEIDDDFISFMKRRIYDISVSSINPITVFYNDEEIKIKTLEEYIKLFIDNDNFIIDDKNKKYSFVICSSNNFNQISFVNGLFTSQGGSHVNYILDMICKEIQDFLKKKYKLEIRKSLIKDRIFIFVNSFIENPKFNSQSKECMESNYDTFGFEYKLKPSMIKKILNLDLIESIIDTNNLMEKKKNKKNDGKKSNRIIIPKLDDAIFAGTAKSSECRLFLTEGDSAKSLAIRGMTVIGRERYGAYPLRGKLLNVQDVSTKKINDNEEITALKKILGLKEGEKYTTLNDLRYGGIIILTDSDYDGFHCANLIINMLYTLWPELVKIGFIFSLSTPIIKLKYKSETIDFYSLSDFNKWKEEHTNIKYNAKYYKGLGTFNKDDAKDIFKKFDKKLSSYVNDDNTKDNINLAFNKKLADDRKEWLMNYDKDNILDNDEKIITISDSINKSLIHFSQYNVYRVVPSLLDGFKPTQRKILFTCFKYLKKNEEIKVAQLMGKVSEKTDYHHGEQSIGEAIVNMAQDFTCSNNVNILHPAGAFGTRLQMGKDKAQSRYIFTYLNEVAYKIFRIEDEPLLKYINADGLMIEPEYYIPIIPFVLCNGVIGIGTGFSTTILPYKLQDIVKYIKDLLDEKKNKILLKPYINGLKGEIKLVSSNKYNSYGIYSRDDKNKTIIIKDLPYGVSTEKYKEFLEGLVASKSKYTKTQFLKDVINRSSDEDVYFELKFTNEIYNSILEEIKNDEEKFYKKFKLIVSLSENNMHLFNQQGIITKFNSIKEIIDMYYPIRLSYYNKRKEYQMNKIKEDLFIIDTKIKFIKLVIDKKIKLINIDDDIITKTLIKYELNYDYLLKMQIRTLTKTTYEKLLKEQEKLNIEYEILLNTDIKNIWNNELDELLDTYNSYKKNM